MTINNFEPTIALVWFFFGLGVLLLIHIGYQAIHQSLASISPKRSSVEGANPLACSLGIREAQPSSHCCLFQSRTGHPLKGGALVARHLKLKRLGMLL